VLTIPRQTTTIPLVAAGLLFPFITSEWKSAVAHKGHWDAGLQTSRDGAILTNYNHAFLERGGLAPSVIDTSHYSVTCDMDTIKLYVHWRTTRAGRVYHFSKVIDHYMIFNHRDPNTVHTDVIRFRACLRNILDWALSSRLETFRQAIHNLMGAEQMLNEGHISEDEYIPDGNNDDASTYAHDMNLGAAEDLSEEPTRKRQKV
jgi:hypothetical protein